MQPEQWLVVPGWDGLYEVSDAGRVRSVAREGETTMGKRLYGGQTVKPIERSNGYLAVNLTSRGRRVQRLVHRIVLTAFVGEAADGQQACHGNGNRRDNRLTNLRWDSVAANHADKNEHGTSPRGSRNPNSKLSEEKVLALRRRYRTNLAGMAAEFGVSRGAVEKVLYGQTWKHVK